MTYTATGEMAMESRSAILTHPQTSRAAKDWTRVWERSIAAKDLPLLESAKTVLSEQRKQMLQKYKEEKQLQKLKEQREKTKRGIFKMGLYRPDAPCFLLSNPNAMKTEPKKAIPSSARITRSKAKEQIEQTKIENGIDVRAIRPGQRQTSEKKVLDKEKTVIRPIAPTSVRITRSTTQAATQIVRTVSTNTTRKPVTRATNDNEPERKAPNKGRPVKKIETKPDKVVSFKLDNEENTLNSQTSATNGMDPDGILSKMENLPKKSSEKNKGKNSFAPNDFMFHPLDGLKTYQVTVMTPTSANAFLTPSYTWNPLKPEGGKTQEATKEILTPKCKTYSTKTVQQDSSKLLCPLGSLTVLNQEHSLNQNEATTKSSSDLSIKDVPAFELNEGQMSQPTHDVPYFRNILQSETEKLTSYCLEWDRKLELDIPDDAKDLIRTAVGQTRLLIKERFKQFEELVNDCEYKRGELKTTCADLDGFWDMVNFQVEDVNRKFNNLTKLEESGWQNNNNTNKRVIRYSPLRLSQRRGTPKSISKPISESKAHEDLLRQTLPPENPDPHSTKSECVDKKILFSNISESRNSIIDDAQCPGLQGLIEMNHGEYGTNKKEEIADIVERMELNSSVTSQDVLMTSPEKNVLSQNNILQEEAKPSQLVLLDNKSVITECHLLDSPSLNFSNQVERRHQEHARHISFGGNLITFSPLRPLSGEQPEEF
ncbi:LOW QUALITY PROTEIN: disks large-associated protein 5-like [Sciurus carolinensis]|uniref:LOW QUALITY PROTEIN: disks large-associated protein 5-like n=1 Tax=Sciurus carolinensis TaxID=30640 RepID=UPI001FB32533|nr:LOW QUALITY PROTEIN: disks large-associated protein 5-like [Sciurus carolinensis]